MKLPSSLISYCLAIFLWNSWSVLMFFTVNFELWIFSIFPVLFFWFFFYFILFQAYMYLWWRFLICCSVCSSWKLSWDKCVHESFTRNKGQVWVWARSSLRKLERKLDHMELRLNFLVEKASWGPRGSPHKKVARSFSPSKYSSCKTSQSQLRNQSSSWKKPHEQLMKKWANFLVKKKITHSKPHEVLMRNQVPRGKSLMRSSWKIGFLMRKWANFLVKSNSSWGNSWGTEILMGKPMRNENSSRKSSWGILYFMSNSWGNSWGTHEEKIPHDFFFVRV